MRLIRLALCAIAGAAGATAAEAAPNHLHLLYTFTTTNGPRDPVLVAPDGTLFGSTYFGGSRKCGSIGCGTLFALKPAAGGYTYTLIHAFGTNPIGTFPGTQPTWDGVGGIYGTFDEKVFHATPPTQQGGPWTYRILYQFPGGENGTLLYSFSPLVRHGGALFGIANNTGSTFCGQTKCGLFFRLDPPAGGRGPWTRTDLYTFGTTAPGFPVYLGGFDTSGAAYVATDLGQGALVRLTPPASGTTWQLSTLATFGGSLGTSPNDLVLAADGTVSGVSYTKKAGVIFQLPPGKPVQALTTIVAGGGYVPTSLAAGPGHSLIGTIFGDYDFFGGIAFQVLPPAAGSQTWTWRTLWDFNTQGPGSNPENLVQGPGSNLFGVLWDEYGSGEAIELSPK